MKLLWRGIGVVVAAVATAGLVWLSTLRTVVDADARPVIRLSWRAVGERVEACREPTPAELEALAPHMRMQEICQRELAPFRLQVALDGRAVVDRELRPAGARADRPTYVFEELAVEPGSHEIEVVFSVVGGSTAPPLRLATRVDPGGRDVLLVTRAGGDGELVLRGNS